MPKRIQLPKPYLIQTIISRVFDPPVMIALLTILAVSLSDLSRRGVIFFTFLLPFMFGLPLAYFVWKLKTHQVTNWDLTNRKERIYPLLAFLGFLLVDIVIVSVLDNPFLLNVFVLYFLWMLGFFLVTLLFKISGHSGITTLAAGLLILWLGWSFWPVLLAIPLVCWARVTRKDHTILQVVAGVIYSLVILRVWDLLL
jgi:putative transposase